MVYDRARQMSELSTKANMKSGIEPPVKEAMSDHNQSSPSCVAYLGVMQNQRGPYTKHDTLLRKDAATRPAAVTRFSDANLSYISHPVQQQTRRLGKQPKTVQNKWRRHPLIARRIISIFSKIVENKHHGCYRPAQ